MPEFDVRTRAALAEHAQPLKRAARIWIALSGGADSTALMLTLLHSEYAAKVRATHVNHGAQTQSEEWAEQVRKLCKRWDVPLDVIALRSSAAESTPKKGGFEAWAREARYRHWHGLLGANDLLLLGHHRADQIETVALKLLQGRLPLPMPATRPLGAKGARLTRPFLNLSPATLRRALEETGQSWIEDPSNADTDFLRNRLRQRVLPRLERSLSNPAQAELERVAGWSESLLRCGQLTQRLVTAVEGSVLVAVKSQNPQQRLADSGGELLRLGAAALECSAAMQAILSMLGVRLRQAQVADALRRLRRQAGTLRGQANRAGIHMPGSALSLWLADDPGDAQSLVVWRTPRFRSQTVQLGDTGRLLVPLHHGELEVMGPPGSKLLLRGLEPGDRLSRKGLSRPVREVLRAAGVPRWARPSLPLLLADPGGDPGEERGTAAGRVLVVPRYVLARDKADAAELAPFTDESSFSSKPSFSTKLWPPPELLAWFRPN